jgi:hypothetical protein
MRWVQLPACCQPGEKQREFPGLWELRGRAGFSDIGVGLNSPNVQNAVKVYAKRLGMQAFSGGMAGASGSIMPSNAGSGADG